MAVIFLSVPATVTEGDPQQLPGSTQQQPLSKERRDQALLSLRSRTTSFLGEHLGAGVALAFRWGN